MVHITNINEVTPADVGLEYTEPLPRLTRDDIQAGDTIYFEGGRHVSSVSGKVLKANRVNLTIEGSYFGNPLVIKVRRDKLEGRGGIERDGQVYEVEA